ncbi:hypothetical protein [Desulfovibrio sp. ZJ369]|uniref:hypothetical protein n=1 Tax=Desulfovibrio sp. ZJ369 TaxID=2709793 RepID=UPI00197D2421|nr:hypothetical protein [Desulfovibrio sp. ZJ369]
MKKALTLIHEIESDEYIFQIKSPSGYMLWPLVRNGIYEIIDDIEKFNKYKKKTSLKMFLKNLKNIFTIFNFPKETYPIVFHQHIVYLDKFDNDFVDPIFGIASRYSSNSISLYDSSFAKLPSSVPYKYYDMNFILRVLNFCSKFSNSKKHRLAAEKMINFIEHKYHLMTNSYLSQKQRESIYSVILEWSKKSILYGFFYSFLWKKLKPKIIFYTSGFYGIDSISVYIAKKLNIHTVEVQHGIIYSNHFAYNFSRFASKHKEFQKYYQNTIFLFGAWFKNKTNCASQKYISGHPYHSLCVEYYKNKNSTNKHILFLPTGGTFLEFYKLSLYTSEKYPNEKILLRPHPTNRLLADNVSSNNNNKNITISYSENLYDVILKSKYVIGDMSTALFAAYACKVPVFSFKNKIAENFLGNENPFPSFASLEELDHLLKKTYTYEHDFYADSWETRYDNFISAVIKKESIN